MFRLIPPLTLASLALSLVVAMFARSALSQPQPLLHPVAPLRTQGVSSCSAMACHHANGPVGSKGSEYGSWIAVDPHARAYRVLFEDASRRMHETLARTDSTLQGLRGAHENPLCLRCHAMGDACPMTIQSDGVGCERCHGPAEKWKNTHYLQGFDRKTPGFNDLRDDLFVRAEVCMKCHVGDALQEVNHDLIAAGHPRLRFDYSAYYAMYPRHWCDQDLERHGPEIELRNWLIGQLISARAALDLLAARADERREAWPEFSEYDCASCHHDLTRDSFRRERRGEGRGRPGSLVWGTWYHALLPTLAETLPAGQPARKQAVESMLENLNRQMRKTSPPVEPVRQEANQAARFLAGWLEESGLNRTKETRLDVRALNRALAGQTAVVDTGWEGATQVYLGLAALHHAQGLMDPNFPARSPLRQPLLDLRRNLTEAFPPSPPVRPKYDTPSGFDPVKVKGLLEEYRKRVE